MEEDLRRRLAEIDAGFREMQQKHREFEQQLAELMHKPYRSDEDDLLETRLKKQKLWLKDQMEARRATWARQTALSVH